MRFSIVTPTRNSERYLAETIESVIFQRGDFEIHHVVVDNRSTDRTGEIVAYYQRLLASAETQLKSRGVNLEFVSGQDNGMYEAINRGFACSEGDVLAWINSDDIYLPGAFNSVARLMQKRPEVAWLKGITSYIDENSEIVQIGQCNLYDQSWIRDGYYGPVFPFIQQDSVFWKRTLWDQVAGCDAKLRLCGDYFLWRDFAKCMPLYSAARYLSCFRRHSGQLSTDINAYWREAATTGRMRGIDGKGFFARCMNSARLPEWAKLAIRRSFLGTPTYRFLTQSGTGVVHGTTAARGGMIQDRVISAVLL